jgi:hypothetical protein
MPQKLKTTLGKAVKVVNFIQARSLNSRIFNIVTCLGTGDAVRIVNSLY